MATTDLHFVTGALHPTRRGIRCDASADNGVQVDAAGLAMANVSTKGTFSAWVMVPDQTGSYAILSFGDASADEFITFSVVAGKLECNCTDATTKAYEVTSTSVVIKPHTWHHVAVVQDGNRPKLYVDGVAVAMTDTVSTTLTKWFKDCTLIDGGHIGEAEEGGAAALSLDFKGYISHVKVWAGTAAGAALSAAEVLDDYHGTAVQATYLHNSWDLEYDLLDDGTGADNGTATGDIIFSAANEFASRLTFLETVPLAADNVTIMADQGVGFAYSILAA